MPAKLVPFLPARSVAKVIGAISSHAFCDSLPRYLARLDDLLNSLAACCWTSVLRVLGNR